MIVDEVLVAAVGLAEPLAQHLAGGARIAASGAPQQLLGGVGEELVASASGLESVIDEGREVVASQRLQVETGGETRGERGSAAKPRRW